MYLTDYFGIIDENLTDLMQNKSEIIENEIDIRAESMIFQINQYRDELRSLLIKSKEEKLKETLYRVKKLADDSEYPENEE